MSIHDPDRNVYTYFKENVDISSNTIYDPNTWIKFHTEILKDIAFKGGAIWLTTKGDLFYRLAVYGNTHTATASKINLVFSNFLQRNIQIIKKLNYRQMHPTEGKIYISELLLVEGDKFNPYILSEFYEDENKLFYRNTLVPTNYLINQPKDEQHKEYPTQKYAHLYTEKYDKSITLQYIFYLANYKESRFNYIMNWLASFFKDLSNRSSIALVLIGEQKSGKDILFNEIIKPLFGNQYCIKINDHNLQGKNLSKLVRDKLFYNFDELSNAVSDNKEIKKNLKDFIGNDTVSTEEIKIFGQTLITISEPYLPYIDKDNCNYTVFNIPDNIESIPIYDSPDSSDMLRFISKKELIDKIKDDLKNFALILKGYKIDSAHINEPFSDDDKACLISGTEDKIKAFSDAIVNNKTKYFEIIKDNELSLYEELMNDFDNKIIKQRNLIKCFSIIYKEENISSGKALMVRLREVNDFFKLEAIFLGTGGVKHFKIT